MQKCRIEFDTSYGNGRIHFSNNQFISRILEGSAWPTLTVKNVEENSPGGGTPHMKGVGMLVGNFELNP